MKLSGALQINQNNLRIRSFTLGGQAFRVRVPLASEMEAISKAVDEKDWSAKHSEMMQPLLEKKEEIESDAIVFDGDNAIVDGNSIKDLAILTAKTEERITQMVRLLVPVDNEFDMSQIQYDDINSEFPFAVQLELMKKIAEVISPGYEEIRKN